MTNAKDHVYQDRDGWYAFINEKYEGPWAEKSAATTAYLKAERQRLVARRANDPALPPPPLFDDASALKISRVRMALEGTHLRASVRTPLAYEELDTLVRALAKRLPTSDLNALIDYLRASKP